MYREGTRMVNNIADAAANELDAAIGTLEEARAAGLLDGELGRRLERQLRALQPALEEVALTMRAQNQLNLVGISRFPLRPLARAVVDLQAYKEEAAGVVRLHKKSRSTADSNGAA
jgi:uncharacterized lipoprotein YmbA